ncbi:hypothetical protein BC629DRAFT_1251537, partial [Irpex lacteus]
SSYVNRPHAIPVTSDKAHKKEPDGYFLFLDHTSRTDERHFWRDAVTPAEFKRKDTHTDLQDDVDKICWDMHQIMKEDPRRRRVFGFTIENTQMRVWMMNRAEVVVSEPFNFITDHEKFIYFVLSQVYAKPHELGIDTTMTLVPVPPKLRSSETPVYDIIVHNAKADGEVEEITVRAVDLIDDVRVQYPLGRGTRVWEVQRVVDGVIAEHAEGRVLKESWVDAERRSEAEIMEQILAAANEEEKDMLSEALLTHVAAGGVLVEGKLDNTRDLGISDADLPTTRRFSLRVSTAPSIKSSSVASAGHSVPSLPAANATTSTQPSTKRQHTRLLMKQLCTPLSKVLSLCQVFEALTQSLNVWDLELLHSIGKGFVHRDLSIGNIMYDPETKTWRLSDLEFAKSLDELLAHDVRTGTNNFMAVEVDLRRYLW